MRMSGCFATTRLQPRQFPKSHFTGTAALLPKVRKIEFISPIITKIATLFIVFKRLYNRIQTTPQIKYFIKLEE